MMSSGGIDPSDVRVARALLSRVCEPGDAVAQALIEAVGVQRCVEVMSGSTPSADEYRSFHELATGSGQRKPQEVLAKGLERWQSRLASVNPARDLASIAKLGGLLLTPEDPGWPVALNDLGPQAPVALWVRGARAFEGTLPALGQTLAIVGSRGATPYGASATRQLCEDVVLRGITVVSGGAYGIDAMAHRSALEAGMEGGWPTYAILACGVDRYYPAGNQELLRSVMNKTVLVSETAPGGTPTRWRFLQRNRLIAALAGATIVVEAAWRSGALNTAAHAAGLGREIGGVPGPIDSPQSAGVHRLMREANAIPITDGAEAAELLGFTAGVSSGVSSRFTSGVTSGASAGVAVAGPAQPDGWATRAGEPRVTDGMRVEDQLVYEALPKNKGSVIAKISDVSGVGVADVRASLGRLSLEGLAQQTNGLWRLAG